MEKTPLCPLHQMSPPVRLQVCCLLGQKYMKVDQLLTLHSYYMLGTFFWILLTVLVIKKLHEIMKFTLASLFKQVLRYVR